MKDKYKSFVPQIQIGFLGKYLLKRFTNSVRQTASWRKDMMPSTFAKRKKNSEKKELTASSTSRMKLR